MPFFSTSGRKSGLGQRRLLVALFWLLLCLLVPARALEIPASPKSYFNDFAGLVRPETASRLEQELTDFERQTSNQILVAIFPKLPDGTTVEDYAQTVFRAWKPGLKDRNNGAILFVFVQSHQIWIQTGYGLEGALPDAICKRIVADEIVPRFRSGDFDGGIVAGVRSMIAATRGEYKGAGTTVAERNRLKSRQGAEIGQAIFFFVVLVLFILISLRARRRGVVYSGRGAGGLGGFWIGGGGLGGGGFGGGSSGGGGGGGFSGGGGDSGGGGAGGSW